MKTNYELFKFKEISENRIKSLAIILLLGLQQFSFAQGNMDVEPKGVYAEINTAKEQEMLIALSDEKRIPSTLDEVLTHPDEYTPTIICYASNILFNQGHKDSAAFWFYTGRLRARIDANLCLDKTAGSAVSELTHYFGPSINKYAYKDIDNLRKIHARTFDYLRTHDAKYDRRWIALHGMQAMKYSLEETEESPIIIEPEDKWPQIKEETIAKFEKDVEKGIKQYQELLKEKEKQEKN